MVSRTLRAVASCPRARSTITSPRQTAVDPAATNEPVEPWYSMIGRAMEAAASDQRMSYGARKYCVATTAKRKRKSIE